MRRAVEGPERDYLSAAEICSYLQLQPKTLQRLRSAGRFPDAVNPHGPGAPVWSWLAVVAWAQLYALTPALRAKLPPPSRRGKSAKDS